MAIPLPPAVQAVAAQSAAAAAQDRIIDATRANNNRALNALAPYTIEIFRPKVFGPGQPVNQGILSFRHGLVGIRTPCWWDVKRIDPGVYIAGAEYMQKRDGGRNGGLREAILLYRKISIGPHNIVVDSPQFRLTPICRDLPANNGTVTANEVYIHKGSKPSDSAACVVIDKQHVWDIWDIIQPKHVENVVVRVSDY